MRKSSSSFFSISSIDICCAAAMVRAYQVQKDAVSSCLTVWCRLADVAHENRRGLHNRCWFVAQVESCSVQPCWHTGNVYDMNDTSVFLTWLYAPRCCCTGQSWLQLPAHDRVPQRTLLHRCTTCHVLTQLHTPHAWQEGKLPIDQHTIAAHNSLFMAYDQNKLVEKLRGINASQQSIETVSMYCQVLKRHATNVVADWAAEYSKQPPPRKLALLFLANDVLQNSRKKGAEYVAAFHKALPRALKAAASSGDQKLAKGAMRLVEIWEERRVFGSHAITSLKDAVGGAATQSLPKDDSLSSVLQQVTRAHEGRLAAAAGCDNSAGVPGDAAPLDPQALVQRIKALTAALASADVEKLARQRAMQTLSAALQQQQAVLTELGTLAAGWQAQVVQLEAAARGAWLLSLLAVYTLMVKYATPVLHSGCCCAACCRGCFANSQRATSCAAPPARRAVPATGQQRQRCTRWRGRIRPCQPPCVADVAGWRCV